LRRDTNVVNRAATERSEGTPAGRPEGWA